MFRRRSDRVNKINCGGGITARPPLVVDLHPPPRSAAEPPHLNWSTAMFRKRRTENGEQATEAGRDSIEVTAS